MGTLIRQEVVVCRCVVLLCRCVVLLCCCAAEKAKGTEQDGAQHSTRKTHALLRNKE